MLHLILKDFYINRKYILMILLYMGFILYSKGTSAPAILFGMSIVSYGILTRSCYCDDKDRGDTFLRTLPIKASTIVLSKYALGVLVMFGASIGLIFLALASGHSLHIYYSSIALSIFTVSLIYTIYLPVFFRYGYMKARTFQTIFFLVIMAASFGLRSLIDIVKSSIPINEGQWLIEPLTNLAKIILTRDVTLILTAIIISLIMLSISIALSLKFYIPKSI